MKMIYMDNAATSWPKPDIVYDTILRTMKYYGANPLVVPVIPWQ